MTSTAPDTRPPRRARPRKPRRHIEDGIQRAVVGHLRWRAAAGVSWFAVPNGGKRSAVEAAIMHGLGVRAGAPDLLIFRAGKAYGLELKSPDWTRTAKQIAMHEELAAAGVLVVTAHGVDEALQVLARWGALK